MDVLYPNCAGLDVHKDTVVACSRRVVGGKAVREVRTFKTTTNDLLALSEWLASFGCTHIVMEATGVYWKPVWNILSDGDFALILANAAHVKNVPGRKTDVNDMARRSARAWSDPWELRARHPDAGAAQPLANPQATHAGAHEPCAASAKDSGGGQHQARFGDLRHYRHERADDHRGPDRR
jgi:hypothetical protein